MTLTKIGASLSGGADLVTITQSSHGFTVGKVLKSSGSNGAYATALANTAANAEVVGIVVQVIDANTFTMALSGRITVDGAVPNVTAGSVLFLSASSAGDLTSTEPTTAAQISKPVAVVTTANSEMLMVNYRGEVISTSTESWDVNGSELILDVDGDTSLHASSDDQIDVQIAGADDFSFTANSLNVLSGSTLSIDSGATLSNSGTLSGFSHSSFTVTQSSHGLVVGNVVRSSGSNGAFAKARANSVGNAEVVGVVTVVSGDVITITTSGEIAIAAAVPDVAAGVVVFLHEDGSSDEGTLTSTEPTGVGEISKPIAIVTHQNSKMVLLPFRGEVITNNAASIADDSVTTAKILADNVTNAKLANMAANTVKVNATTSSDNPTDISMASATLSGAIADGDVLLIYDASTTSLKTVAKSVLVAGIGGDLSFGGDTFGANKVIGANDAYSLSLETSGNTALTIAATGEVTMPLQPAFSAYLTSNATNVTGNAGTTWTMTGMTEDFDRGSDFNVNGTFTAPVAGIYYFHAQAYVAGFASSPYVIAPSVRLYKGNTEMIQGGNVDTAGDMVSSGRIRVSGMLELAATDTVTARVTATNAGSNLVDVQGGSSPRVTFFMGYLVA